ncbi:mRNA splicing factor [Lipomyces tetrasporus]|uniref:mRNA splicing factor n=1 Tax=Lipomyces tetrasporus TaxID=54092 RepID=A0AAD7QKZ3_9ASCO|nr:mRNA splicing factor [Lipomyces tetrasporus]KAJ8097008.1 mRNA splicing factor [Lipomyces tetrasporus]
MSSLDSQVLSRKEKLAQLRNLKRKRDEARDEDGGSAGNHTHVEKLDDGQDPAIRLEGSTDDHNNNDVGTSILPRRNYDPETRAPRQGYFEPPTANSDIPTVEEEAARIEREAAVEDDELPVEKGSDSEVEVDSEASALQPRPANWDLKRQLADKLEILQRQTDVALNRIVRERLQGSKGTDALPAGLDLNKVMDETEKYAT